MESPHAAHLRGDKLGDGGACLVPANGARALHLDERGQCVRVLYGMAANTHTKSCHTRLLYACLCTTKHIRWMILASVTI